MIDSEGYVLHFIWLPQYAHDLVMELLNRAKTSGVHTPVRYCVFHYQLELIHPFADGKGRVDRLWHTLLLPKWNPSSTTKSNNTITINASNDAGGSTVFIEFMLSATKASLIEEISPSDEVVAAANKILA